MDFQTAWAEYDVFLMEGALGERLKREYGLVFDEQVAMASLVYQEMGRTALKALWQEYREIADMQQLPFLATTPTRRANWERVEKSGFCKTMLQENVAFLREIQQEKKTPMFIGGLMGCKGDAYSGAPGLSTAEAKSFHIWQADLFAQSGVDFLYAGIMPCLPEAIGMAQAMAETEVPYIISFMIRKNGCLLDGTTIHDAIAAIDEQVKLPPCGYMVNCVHPSILQQALSQPFLQTAFVKERFVGIQGNTSALSPEELDNSPVLQQEAPEIWARQMLDLRQLLPLKILGGCCGTDHRHLQALATGLNRKS